MRVIDAYEAVSKLGFEDSLEDAKAFYFALNRAVSQINAIRPRTATFDIYHRPPPNLISGADFGAREVSSKLEVAAEGAKAYYFEINGEGSYKVEYWDESAATNYVTVRDENFSTTGFEARRGIIRRDDGTFCDGEVRLTFFGDLVFSCRNVALYDRLYSSDEKKIIAYEPYTGYDISALCDDFISLAANPIELVEYEYINRDYKIEDGRVLLLPHDKCGIYRVRYNRKPKELEYRTDPTLDDKEIDLDADLAELVPLLTASYVWIDDEAEKAAYYLARYQERAQVIEYKAKSYSPISYETNRW